MYFAKYQGIGNDFVMLADPEDRISLTPGVARRICDRHFGVGGDGVIRVGGPAEGGELFMDYVNSDGSMGEMCGNGIRCLALFARDRNLTDATELKVATRSGLKVVTVLDDARVQVDMGEPLFDALSIPVSAPDPLRVELEAAGQSFTFVCLSMGNPHAVTFVDHPAAVDLPTLGPAFEDHEVFSAKANVEFARVDSPGHVTMVVWERGAGATLACGTGACAAAVASRVLHGTDENVTVSLPGGDLEISWTGGLETPAPVLLTGPAERSFEGDIDLEAYA